MFVRLIIPFLFLLTGCGVSQTVYWSSWSDWSKWEKTETVETRIIKITSEPSQAEVYINGRYEGLTPLTISVSYPVLQSEKKRYKYNRTHTNATPEWLLFSKGDRPGSKKVIDSEKETRNRLGNATHKVVVKKEGRIPAHKFISHIDSKAHFVLKKKLCLFFEGIRIEDETKLSVAQKMYDAVFEKKYKKNIRPEDLKGIFESDEHFRDLFNFTDSKSCHSLNCKLLIRNEYTSLDIAILDPKGKKVMETSSRFKTGFEREEFLSELRKQISSATSRIYRNLSEG